MDTQFSWCSKPTNEKAKGENREKIQIFQKNWNQNPNLFAYRIPFLP